MARKYTDQFTLDGRVEVVPGVTRQKVEAVRDLTNKHLAGDRIASATLHEALTTSDAIFNLAHLATLNFIPNYDAQERVWQQVAGTRTVPDLEPATLVSIGSEWTNSPGGEPGSSVLGPKRVSPTIPEGANYPYAYVSGVTAEGGQATKKGFMTDITLEARLNQARFFSIIDALPSEMEEIAKNTEEDEVFGALTTQAVGVNSQLAGGDVPTGGSVDPNAPFSRDALIRAIIELGQRQINGRNVRVSGGYNVIVPAGYGVFAQFILNQTFAEVKDGNFVLNIEGYNPLAGVSVVEADALEDGEWFLVPKPGSTRRPILERLEVAGYADPQLFVDNHVGTFFGGASVSPFEGNFSRDVITLKLRQFGGGVVWDGGLGVVYSKGDSSPVA